MQINRVVLENYGVYRGYNLLDLAPRQKYNKYHPIVLFGGKNGAGKTTLLDAVRLGLYGKASLGERTSQRFYEEHLQDLIHTSKDLLIQPESAKVGIEFDFVLRGDKETYYIERGWTANGNNKVMESFQIRRQNGLEIVKHQKAIDVYENWPLLSEIQAEHWEAFVADIVPERLSQLFFFDGEKIKKIAEDLTSTSAVESAINSLLGLDLIRRLQADLNIYKTKEAKRFAPLPVLKRMKELEKKRQDLEESMGLLLGEKIPEKQKRIEESTGELNRCETRLREEGSIFALQRESKKEKKALLEQNIDQLKKQIRRVCEDAFPLSLAKKLNKRLNGQLLVEKGIREHQIVSRELKALEDQLLVELQRKGFSQRDLRRTIKEVIQLRCEKPPELKEKEVLHGLSENDHMWIHSAFEKAKSQNEEMKELALHLEQDLMDLQTEETELRRAPEKETLKPLFNKYQRITQKLAECETEKKILERELNSLKNELASCKRESGRLETEVGEHKATQNRFGLIEKLNKASESYLEEVTEIKVQSLRHAVTSCFNHLARKQDLVKEITVNPKTYQITLYDDLGRVIPRERLSAGEKQILAVSILWGLANTSGRPLPVIIDTPLGRLDSDHRLNFVRNYFPNAGHQVILLSTDTEVDKTLFSELKPNISHCYNLHYDMAEGRTYAKEGYFWEEK